MNIYTAEQIRQIEAEEFARRDSYEIMQMAGAAVAQHAQKMLANQTEQILLVAGPGNNGGDAYIAAAQLHKAGYKNIKLFMPQQPKTKDAQKALQSWHKQGGGTSARLEDFAKQKAQLIIDGIFGIGINRRVTGEWLQWIQAINQKKTKVLAIDIPSGLHTDTGNIMGGCVKAQKTVSFFGAKAGFYQNAGSKVCGEIIIDNLGRQSTETCG